MEPKPAGREMPCECRISVGAGVALSGYLSLIWKCLKSKGFCTVSDLIRTRDMEHDNKHARS